VSDPDPSVTVETKFGKTRMAVQVSILGLVGFLVLHVTLLSDRHNDGRYVSLETYQKDRENDERFRVQVNSGLTWRMDQQDKKLEEISSDIKALLRRNQ
jgi:hypothetical protein